MRRLSPSTLLLLVACSAAPTEVRGPASTGHSLLLLDQGTITAIDADQLTRLSIDLREPAREVVVASYAQTLTALGLGPGVVTPVEAGQPLPPPNGVWSARVGSSVSDWSESKLPDALESFRSVQPTICKTYVGGQRAETLKELPLFAGLLSFGREVSALTATLAAQRLVSGDDGLLHPAALDLPPRAVPLCTHNAPQGRSWIGGRSGDGAFLAGYTRPERREVLVESREFQPLLALASGPEGTVYALDAQGSLLRFSAEAQRLEGLVPGTGTVTLPRELLVLAEGDVLLARAPQWTQIERWTQHQGLFLEPLPIIVGADEAQEEWVQSLVRTSRGEIYASTHHGRYLRRLESGSWTLVRDRKRPDEKLRALAAFGDGAFVGAGVIAVIDLYDPSAGRMCDPFVSVLGGSLAVEHLLGDGERIWAGGARYQSNDRIVSRYLMPVDPELSE